MPEYLIVTHDQLLGLAFLTFSSAVLITIALNILFGEGRRARQLDERLWDAEDQNSSLYELLCHAHVQLAKKEEELANERAHRMNLYLELRRVKPPVEDTFNPYEDAPEYNQ